MKALWLARLARPDLSKPLNDLTTHIHTWSRADDKIILRAFGYISTSKHYKLESVTGDEPQFSFLRLYTDADYVGDDDTTKSMASGILVLVGPRTWFPLAWICKRQKATSKSTTEADMAAMALGIFNEHCRNYGHYCWAGK